MGKSNGGIGVCILGAKDGTGFDIGELKGWGILGANGLGLFKGWLKGVMELYIGVFSFVFSVSILGKDNLIFSRGVLVFVGCSILATGGML